MKSQRKRRTSRFASTTTIIMTLAFLCCAFSHPAQHFSVRAFGGPAFKRTIATGPSTSFLSSGSTTTTTTTTSTTSTTMRRRREKSTALFSSSSSSRNYGRTNRGLEQNRESATPSEGGMTLYCKAAEDQISVGDCPFAHYVRLILEEKGLPYELKPTAPNAKPTWLLNYYDGKMPALRHRKECYVESNVIGSYLEFFWPEPSLSVTDGDSDAGAATAAAAEAAVDGFFPAVAKYLKDTSDDSKETLGPLKVKLQSMEDHLAQHPEDSYLTGTKDQFTLVDCRIIPQLYHLSVGIEGFKNGQPNLKEEFPHVHKYLERSMARPSFQATKYPPDTVIWGWGHARK